MLKQVSSQDPKEVEASKTALIVGPAFFQYNEAIGNAFRNAGYRVRIVDSPVHNPSGLLNRIGIDLAGKFGITAYRQAWKRGFNRRVLRCAVESRAQVLLVIKGDWVDPQVFSACPAAVKWIWFQDAAKRCGPDHQRLARIADAVFVFEATDIDYLASCGVDRNKVHFLPMGFDDHVYRPLGLQRDIDVSFVGRMYDHRKMILADLVRDVPSARFRFFGRYVRFKEPRTWLQWVRVRSDARLRHIYRNRDISPEQVNELYNRSKIVLNIHHGQSKDGCNPRVFEISGSGAFQICDDNAFVRTDVCDEIVQFNNYEDLRDKIESYLHDEAERDRITKISCSAMQSHTFENRVGQMLSLID